MTAVDVALAALYIMPCVIFFFFVKNDMLEKPDKSKEKAEEQSKENNNKNKKTMETNINIAEILKDKPEGTKLYSPLFGEVYFVYVRNSIIIKHHEIATTFFDCKGRYCDYIESEMLLFPSKEMRDWKKFAWKKGDVLRNDCGFVCIFKEWASDDYTKFNGCYFDGMPNAETAKYSKLDNNTARSYIRELEKNLGGKLNFETLEIERNQPELKPFDRVLVKDTKKAAWQISLFGFKDYNYYYCIGGARYEYCIPYEGNEHLLGTR